MNLTEYISAFKKFIETVVVPKYPEIYEFEVVRGPKKEWNFNKKDWDPTKQSPSYLNQAKEAFEDRLKKL